MRLTTLSLRNYGNFASEDINFDARPGKINLLVAPNGSGKSVLRNAFCDLLFGIGGQTPMGFRFGYAGMRISANAITRDGEAFTFGRRKGQGNTLVDGEGTTIDPVTLARLLGRTDRMLLERLFALDTPRLREGEEQLLASNGALAAALVTGAGGTRDAGRLRGSLEAARDALAPLRRSSQRPFYVEQEKYSAARRLLSQSLLKPDQWEKLEQEQYESARRQKAENERADAGSAEIARMERVRRVAPWLAAHDEATRWLVAHHDAPALDADLQTRLADVRGAIVIAQERANADREQAAQLALQLQSIELNAPLLTLSADIDRLVEAAGAARKAVADLPDVQSELVARQRRIAELLQELGSSTPVADAGTLIPPRATVARARRLITAWRQQTVSMNASRRQIAELTGNLAQIETEQAAMPRVPETQALELLVQEIRSEGDPARRRQTFVAAMEEAEIAVAGALARVPGWTEGTPALIEFAPLQVATYDRLAGDLVTARNEELNCRKQAEAAKIALAQAEERLTATATPGAIVSEHDLNAARAHRDHGWQLIYRQAFLGNPVSEEEQVRFSGELPLPLAFERAMSATDNMADSRMRHHAVIVQTEMQHVAVAKAKTMLEELQERYRLTGETLAAASRAWSQLCSRIPPGGNPTLSEVHAFLAARDRFIEAVRSRTACATALHSLDGQHSAWLNELCTCLDLIADRTTTISRLLNAADQALKHGRDARAAQTRILDRRQIAVDALAKERLKVETATAETADWAARWHGMLIELGRPADEEPEVTDEVLQVLAELAGEHQAAESLSARIKGMSADHDRFRADTDRVVLSIASDLQALAPLDAVTEISRRLLHQRGLERQHTLLGTQLTACRESAAKAEGDLADHEAGLRALLLVIGADSIVAAEARLSLSAERRLWETRLADAQARLQGAGQGLSVEQLRAEVAVLSLDDIDMMIERASRDRKEANELAQVEAAQFARITQQMDRERAATTANVAMMQQHASAAKIGRVLEEALVLHVASAILEKSLASLEATGDSVLLRRISELFQTLTGGVYGRVYTVTEEVGSPRLVLQESRFKGEQKEVKDLSEGTRDQLFLALRLAAIEEHAATAPPLPFIGDDILQTFDDDRAVATMRVLLDLSDKVQVILLTHHRHLLDLAAHLPSDAVHRCTLREVLPA